MDSLRSRKLQVALLSYRYSEAPVIPERLTGENFTKANSSSHRYTAFKSAECTAAFGAGI